VSLPTPHTVGWRERVIGAKDSRNKPTETYADAIVVPVSAIYPPGPEDQPNVKNKAPVDRTLHILAPSWPGGPKDKVVIDGREWVQEGHPEDYRQGPWVNTIAGVRVTVTRAEEAR